jgi:hypothetical protein
MIGQFALLLRRLGTEIWTFVLNRIESDANPDPHSPKKPLHPDSVPWKIECRFETQPEDAES